MKYENEMMSTEPETPRKREFRVPRGERKPQVEVKDIKGDIEKAYRVNRDPAVRKILGRVIDQIKNQS